MTTAPPIPDTVPDYLGNPVAIGDTIAYGTLRGRSADLSTGEVLDITWSLSDYSAPILKLKVRGTQRASHYDYEAKRFVDAGLENKQPGWILADRRHFVKI